MSRRLSQIASVAGTSGASKLPISPLVGEMSGRTERGAKDRYTAAFILRRCWSTRRALPTRPASAAC
ncbi:MAG: hypothetical protein E5X83_00235 [Mesorhizobium sp.]|nr:MAG: hypothetical protein EOR57_15235 [Mesorhizobium sp.]RWM74552.1 MAG: hypothetical protein EOR82_04810 [Mesorhizobium sp.]TIO27884.1 MAG: hypothetical protein E5X83_00235 [Mesorhizobium sp.]TJV63406.1 MAG: hypothetical protein E5X82_05970 [Mesorhizobium sp.]